MVANSENSDLTQIWFSKKLKQHGCSTISKFRSESDLSQIWIFRIGKPASLPSCLPSWVANSENSDKFQIWFRSEFWNCWKTIGFLTFWKFRSESDLNFIWIFRIGHPTCYFNLIWTNLNFQIWFPNQVCIYIYYIIFCLWTCLLLKLDSQQSLTSVNKAKPCRRTGL